MEFRKTEQERLATLFQTQTRHTSGVKVLLLGRPYTVLSDTMNHHIPQMFEKMGVQTFFQDMVDTSDLDLSPSSPCWRKFTGNTRPEFWNPPMPLL